MNFIKVRKRSKRWGQGKELLRGQCANQFLNSIGTFEWIFLVFNLFRGEDEDWNDHITIEKLALELRRSRPSKRSTLSKISHIRSGVPWFAHTIEKFYLALHAAVNPMLSIIRKSLLKMKILLLVTPIFVNSVWILFLLAHFFISTPICYVTKLKMSSSVLRNRPRVLQRRKKSSEEHRSIIRKIREVVKNES